MLAQREAEQAARHVGSLRAGRSPGGPSTPPRSDAVSGQRFLSPTVSSSQPRRHSSGLAAHSRAGHGTHQGAWEPHQKGVHGADSFYDVDRVVSQARSGPPSPGTKARVSQPGGGGDSPTLDTMLSATVRALDHSVPGEAVEDRLLRLGAARDSQTARKQEQVLLEDVVAALGRARELNATREPERVRKTEVDLDAWQRSSERRIAAKSERVRAVAEAAQPRPQPPMSPGSARLNARVPPLAGQGVGDRLFAAAQAKQAKRDEAVAASDDRRSRSAERPQRQSGRSRAARIAGEPRLPSDCIGVELQERRRRAAEEHAEVQSATVTTFAPTLGRAPRGQADAPADVGERLHSKATAMQTRKRAARSEALAEARRRAMFTAKPGSWVMKRRVHRPPGR